MTDRANTAYASRTLYLITSLILIVHSNKHLGPLFSILPSRDERAACKKSPRSRSLLSIHGVFSFLSFTEGFGLAVVRKLFTLLSTFLFISGLPTNLHDLNSRLHLTLIHSFLITYYKH
jgi:hypothetical protein